MKLKRSLGLLITGLMTVTVFLAGSAGSAAAQWDQMIQANPVQQAPLLPGPVCSGEPGDPACGCDPEVQDCGCTSIQVSKGASTDGSVMTAHSCDGNYRTWLQIQEAREILSDLLDAFEDMPDVVTTAGLRSADTNRRRRLPGRGRPGPASATRSRSRTAPRAKSRRRKGGRPRAAPAPRRARR